MDDDLIGCFLALVAMALAPFYFMLFAVVYIVELLVDAIRWLIERNRRG